VDSLAEKYPGWSSYNYCVDDSINSIDPNGTYTLRGWEEDDETLTLMRELGLEEQKKKEQEYLSSAESTESKVND